MPLVKLDFWFSSLFDFLASGGSPFCSILSPGRLEWSIVIMKALSESFIFLENQKFF
jgi:hypothetical protein